MRVRLEEGLQLVITAESYVEQVALGKWADTVKGECALLIEPYAQQFFILETGYCNCPITKTEAVLAGSLCPQCHLPRR